MTVSPDKEANPLVHIESHINYIVHSLRCDMFVSSKPAVPGHDTRCLTTAAHGA
jgi:hypothetical protein